MDGIGSAESLEPWSARSERERLLMTCPARAAELAEAALDAGRPPGIAGELLSRREHGLPADEQYVRDLHVRFAAAGPEAHEMAAASGGGTGVWSMAWGFLMTAEEERGLWRRQAELHPLAGAAEAYLARLPVDHVGGVWLEQVENGIVVNLTVEADVRGVLAHLRALAAPGQQVRAVRVRWSTAELEVFLERALAALGDLPSGWGVDVMNGCASIMVRSDVPRARATVREVVDPCAVHLRQGECVPL
jgi:hypothetical protein